MQTRSSDENSVCLSVRPSVKGVNCDKTDKKSVHIFAPYERSFSLVFWEKEWLVAAPLLPEKFGSKRPHWSENANFQSIFFRSSSAVTPSEKKSTTRFPMSLRWSSYVAPKSPKGTQKRKTANFGIKSHFAWRESATKFLCEKKLSATT